MGVTEILTSREADNIERRIAGGLRRAGLDTGDVMWVSAAKGTGVEALASHLVMLLTP